jgi:hypothetical protein
MYQNKVVTKLKARSNCDVTSFRSDMGTDGPKDGPTDRLTDQRTNIVSYRGATLRLEIVCERQILTLWSGVRSGFDLICILRLCNWRPIEETYGDPIHGVVDY